MTGGRLSRLDGHGRFSQLMNICHMERPLAVTMSLSDCIALVGIYRMVVSPILISLSPTSSHGISEALCKRTQNPAQHNAFCLITFLRQVYHIFFAYGRGWMYRTRFHLYVKVYVRLCYTVSPSIPLSGQAMHVMFGQPTAFYAGGLNLSRYVLLVSVA